MTGRDVGKGVYKGPGELAWYYDGQMLHVACTSVQGTEAWRAWGFHWLAVIARSGFADGQPVPVEVRFNVD